MRAAASSEVGGSVAAKRGRIVAIDVARGIALVAMTIYHFSWDLAFFGWIDAALVNARPWVLFARAIATSFLFLVGVSLVLAHGRGIRWRDFLVRLAQVTAGALAITVVTYFFVPGGFVFFGILHAIALFSLLALPFLLLSPWLTLVVAAFVWTLGNFWSAPLFDPAWLVWTGLATVPPVSNDYVPVFPFFAATLAGVAFARIATSRGWFERMRSWRLAQPIERPLDAIGRHSLLYYLVHQPVLFALLYAVGFATGGPDIGARAERQWIAECGVVRDEAYCRAYVACVSASAKRDGLYDALARNRVADADRERVAVIVNACAGR